MTTAHADTVKWQCYLCFDDMLKVCWCLKISLWLMKIKRAK